MAVMKLLLIKSISKEYKLNKYKSFTALENINLSFPKNGFHSIVGKSGSGKSTLLNIIARLDNPTKGEVYLNGKKYTFKEKKSFRFYRDDIGVVFQNFNLIESYSTLFNVALPLIVSGVNKRKAYKKAKEILKYVNIQPDLYNLQASRLSGGEKQRVAIARALIRNPSILLCDEPTGALDSANSILVMELLKKISKSKLVIMVSHNLQLVDEYSDRIIELSDGKVINNYFKNKIIDSGDINNSTYIGGSSWTSNFSLKNYFKRFKRNLFVVLSLTICMIMANLVVGFISGKDQAILNACYEQLDFGVGTISEEEVVSNTGILKLSKSIRPNLEELNKDKTINELFVICPNFSAILPQNSQISYDELLIEDTKYTPIYSFNSQNIDESLLTKGALPKEDTLEEVVINQKCYKNLKNKIKKDPINEIITFNYKVETNYVLESGEYIVDTFEYQMQSKITGVVKELDYLSTNKIFYSHVALESYLQEVMLINLSTYYQEKITWYDRVINAENYSYLSSYSYLLFLKDFHYRNKILQDDIISKKYTYSSNSLVIASSLINFLEVAKYALILFLVISSVGAILILSIISLTNYSEDRKISAILTVLGAKSNQIEDIYLNESFFSALFSLILSLILSYPLSIVCNTIINKYIAIKNVVVIPYQSFLRIPFFYPFILFVVVFVLVSLSTLIPIKFSKKNVIRLELQSND